MKAIVSVIGKDKAGIIAKVSTALAERNVNIEDHLDRACGPC